MSIHSTIKAKRQALGLSHTALAKRITELDTAAPPVSRQMVQQWEKEGGTAPRRGRLPFVAKALGLQVADLIDDGPKRTAAGFSHLATLAAEMLDTVETDDERHRVYAMWTRVLEFRKPPPSVTLPAGQPASALAAVKPKRARAAKT